MYRRTTLTLLILWPVVLTLLINFVGSLHAQDPKRPKPKPRRPGAAASPSPSATPKPTPESEELKEVNNGIKTGCEAIRDNLIDANTTNPGYPYDLLTYPGPDFVDNCKNEGVIAWRAERKSGPKDPSKTAYDINATLLVTDLNLGLLRLRNTAIDLESDKPKIKLYGTMIDGPKTKRFDNDYVKKWFLDLRTPALVAAFFKNIKSLYANLEARTKLMAAATKP